jgi:hypothetical protein
MMEFTPFSLDRFWKRLHNAALKFPEVALQALPLLHATLPQLERVVVAKTHQCDGRTKLHLGRRREVARSGRD